MGQGHRREAAVIPKECKRLAEVDFPIAVVSRHAVREKSIRHGHPSTLHLWWGGRPPAVRRGEGERARRHGLPSTLHLWWARRPLASSRAMLLALLLPEPGDEHCPEEF